MQLDMSPSGSCFITPPLHDGQLEVESSLGTLHKKD